MSFCDARPVKFTVTKLTIPVELMEFLLTFLKNIQIFEYDLYFIQLTNCAAILNWFCT